MTKVLASGVLEGINLYVPEAARAAGKDYQVADVVVAGQAFKGIYKGAKTVQQGMAVEVIVHPVEPGRKFGQKEIRGVVPASTPQTVVSAPAPQPARAPFEQDKISRQWATSQAICYITLAAQHGAVPKKVLGDNTLLFQMVGQYANLLFNSVQNSSNFEKLPTFTGQVNEATEQQEELV